MECVGVYINESNPEIVKNMSQNQDYVNCLQLYFVYCFNVKPDSTTQKFA